LYASFSLEPNTPLQNRLQGSEAIAAQNHPKSKHGRF